MLSGSCSMTTRAASPAPLTVFFQLCEVSDANVRPRNGARAEILRAATAFVTSEAAVLGPCDTVGRLDGQQVDLPGRQGDVQARVGQVVAVPAEHGVAEQVGQTPATPGQVRPVQ